MPATTISAGIGLLTGVFAASFYWWRRLGSSSEAFKKELADQEANYQILTHNLAAAVVIRDAQGKITYCSPFTEVLTGYALQEIHSDPKDFFLSVVHPDDRDKYERASKIGSTGEAYQFRYRLYHKTGIEMWLETRTVPIYDQAGNFVSSLSITLDITGTARYQRLVEDKNRDLHDFSYMVSHDLKAPIFTIKGMLSILEEDLKGKAGPEIYDTIAHISKAALRLEQLVTGVLEYSRVSGQDGKVEDVDLNVILEDIKEEVAGEVKKVGGSLSITNNLPNVRADKTRIYQVFRNLISNAIKYRDQTRPLSIDIALQHNRNERYVCIAVKDNGLGIPADKVESIFRPFQRAHGNQIEGSGIGLACVKKILEKAGGEIDVQSKEGQGSCFMVSLLNRN